MSFTIAITCIAFYSLCLGLIFLYSLAQLNLALNYKKKKTLSNQKSVSEYLHTTIQLPIYNEKYVVERLINSVCEMEYPNGKLEIQVLDDSTDETSEIISKLVFYWKAKGIDIIHIQRKDRIGFKAGALNHGLSIAKGELIAIFDADFIPQKDFLLQTVAKFEGPEIGVVQTRWGHINRNYSWLTKIQAFALDAHFTVEQVGRNAANHFINFNGTAGIWRKECILDAGSWQSDTLTEDLDLSYRAQLKGWRFVYLENIETPAELPVVMDALKSQQYRWNKGAAECARKNLIKVLKSKELKFSTKLNAIAHLLNSSVFIFIFLAAILSIPALYIKQEFIEFKLYFLLGSLFLFSFFILTYFYWLSFSYINKKPRKGGSFLFQYLVFLSVSMGLSLHNSLAVIEGLIGRKTPFVRTPKFASVGKMAMLKGNSYFNKKVSVLVFVELLFAAVFFAAIIYGISVNDFGLIPFHGMLFFGFLFVSLQGLMRK